MRAHVLLRYGKTSEVLALRDHPDPPLAPTEVRIQTRASARDHDRVRALGASELVDFRAQRFEERVRDLPRALDHLASGDARGRVVVTVR